MEEYPSKLILTTDLARNIPLSEMTETIYDLPDRYANFDDFCSLPRRCIAPTKTGWRCKNSNKATIIAQAQGDSKSICDIRNRLRNKIDAIILQSCCCDLHKVRLSDATECLARLVNNYNRDAGRTIIVPPTGMNLRSDTGCRTQGACGESPVSFRYERYSQEFSRGCAASISRLLHYDRKAAVISFIALCMHFSPQRMRQGRPLTPAERVSKITDCKLLLAEPSPSLTLYLVI